ncbi:MAG: hypothetical protein RLZZ360_194 [Candidatus Parcubacteria bacterium]|jgi:hypothetical protein
MAKATGFATGGFLCVLHSLGSVDTEYFTPKVNAALHLLDLEKVEFNRCLAPEHSHQDLYLT